MKLLLAAVLAGLLLPTSASALTLKGNVAPRHRAWVAASQAPLPAGTVTLTRSGCYFTWSCFDHDVIRLPRRPQSFAQERSLLLHELGHVFDERHMNPKERGQFSRVAGTLPSGTPLEEAFAEQYAACALGISRAEISTHHRTLLFYEFAPSAAAERQICAALWGWRQKPHEPLAK